MAVSQNFLTGRMSGSAGGTRFSAWRGLNIVASKPIVVRQNVTDAVKLNRNKMSVVGKAISKINANTKSIYSLGISKTTPFADTVKFFRNRILDTLKLSPSLLSGAKFGTGNAEGHSYSVTSNAVDTFTLEAVLVNPIFDTSDTQIDLLVVSDDLSKIVYISDAGRGNLSVGVVLQDYGFETGDKIQCATKAIKLQPGNDLSGKVKFLESATFITLG